MHGLVKLTQFCAGADPTSKFTGGGDFSDIQIPPGSALGSA